MNLPVRRMLERLFSSRKGAGDFGGEPLSLSAPWVVGRDDEFRVTLAGEGMPGKGDFLRFDVYPLHGPLHKMRHHGFWDVPVEQLGGRESRFSFSGDSLQLRTPQGTLSFRAVWRSKLPLLGYAMVHLSLWEGRRQPPRQKTVLSSMHLFWNPGENLPLDFLFISLTQRCNLSCPMCMRHSPGHRVDADVLPDVIDPVLSACPDLHSVFLGGIGEPLLYEGLADLVRAVKGKMPAAGQVGMNTNGMLMDGERAAQLVDAGVDWICFSVDGAKKETVERIRKGADFRRLKANIAATVQCREKAGRKGPWLVSNFVVQEGNVEEVVPFVDLADSLGLDAVSISHRRDFREGEFRMLSGEMLGPVFAAAEAAGRERGITVTLPALRPSGEFRCRFMQSTYLLLDGEAIPCCRMLPGAYPGRTESFGSVKAKPLSEIWNGPRYRDFRERVHSDNPPEVCRNCPYASGLLT